MNSLSLLKYLGLYSAVFSLSLLCSQPVISSAQAETRVRGFNMYTGITDADIDALQRFGPNTVRYAIAWNEADDATLEEYNAHIDAELPRIDEIVSRCAGLGIKVILNLHSPPGGFLSRNPSYHRMFAEAQFQQAAIDTWVKLATRYKDNANVVAYDLYNEPAQHKVAAGLKDSNQLHLATINAIRALGDNHKIIVEAVYGNRVSRLKKINLPNIEYSFHIYYPHSFTHQGIARNNKASYPTKKVNKALVKNYLQQFVKFQKKNKVPIFIGEFSMVRWAPGKSSYLFLKDLIGLFEKNKWSWTYHIYRNYDGWSVEHSSNKNDPNIVEGFTDRGLLLKKYFDLD